MDQNPLSRRQNQQKIEAGRLKEAVAGGEGAEEDNHINLETEIVE